MSMYPAHRGMGAVPPGNGGNRLNDLLDQIRAEFETQLRATENYEHQSKLPRRNATLIPPSCATVSAAMGNR